MGKWEVLEEKIEKGKSCNCVMTSKIKINFKNVRTEILKSSSLTTTIRVCFGFWFLGDKNQSWQSRILAASSRHSQAEPQSS